MKERPILMNEFSVRATLEDLKTNTRRVMKDLPDSLQFHTHRIRKAGEDFWVAEIQLSPELRLCSAAPGGWALVRGGIRCPYGVPGDRLWVRETWAAHFMYDDVPPREARSGLPDDNLWYRVDGEESEGTHGCPAEGRRGKWRPGIFMPRWASRILLEVKDVRVERLQEITEEDAKAEGVEPYRAKITGRQEDFAGAFRDLWDSLNAKRGFSWDSNTWVWVVVFRRVND